ncbi:MAG TPA: helix-hairpin-helix domain-containing protein [Polyangia bacterium]|nr:helix-hairpin-helix domain-containing protein [Polyangia bacterium]
MNVARALLAVGMVLSALGFAVRALRAPGSLGRAGPPSPCAIPVERPGRGVVCADGTSTYRAGDREGGGRMAPDRLAAWGAPVDLNHASVEELASLEGIGPKLGARIVAARPFGSVEEVAQVRGVGRRRLARLRPRLFLDEGAVDRVR